MIFCFSLALALLIPCSAYSMKYKPKKQFDETATAFKKIGLKIDPEKEKSVDILPPLITALGIVNAGVAHQELLPPVTQSIEQIAVGRAMQEFNNQQDYTPQHEKRKKPKSDGKKKYLALHHK